MNGLTRRDVLRGGTAAAAVATFGGSLLSTTSAAALQRQGFLDTRGFKWNLVGNNLNTDTISGGRVAQALGINPAPFAAQGGGPLSQGDVPNFVIILIDDMGFRFMDSVITPNLSELRLLYSFTLSPICINP